MSLPAMACLGSLLSLAAPEWPAQGVDRIGFLSKSRELTRRLLSATVMVMARRCRASRSGPGVRGRPVDAALGRGLNQ